MPSVDSSVAMRPLPLHTGQHSVFSVIRYAKKAASSDIRCDEDGTENPDGSYVILKETVIATLLEYCTYNNISDANIASKVPVVLRVAVKDQYDKWADEDADGYKDWTDSDNDGKDDKTGIETSTKLTLKDYNITFIPSEYSSQNIYVSLSARLYFNSSDINTISLGDLLANWIGDQTILASINDITSDGIAARIAANIDLASLDLSDGFNSILDSDFSNIELGAEFIKTDDQGYIVTDKYGNTTALAGLYLYHGTLYLNGYGLFEDANQYSYVPDFMNIVKNIANYGMSFDEFLNGLTAEIGIASSSAESSTSSERDATLELFAQDTSLQIVITKALISVILSVVLPELGSVDEIFDAFSISLGIDFGTIDYYNFAGADAAETATNLEQVYVEFAQEAQRYTIDAAVERAVACFRFLVFQPPKGPFGPWFL